MAARRSLVAEKDGKVTFAWRPNGSPTEEFSSLPVHAFLRRVLLHVLPKGLHKIRYFGWMHPRAKKRFLRIATLLEVPLFLGGSQPQLRLNCPHCKSINLVHSRRIPGVKLDSS